MTQHRQNSRPKSEHQKKTKRSGAGKIGTGPDRPRHGLPVGPTMARGVAHGRASWVARPCALVLFGFFSFFFVPLRVLRIFSGFAL